MSAANSLHQQFGGLELPVLASDVDGDLTPLDPARRVLADLFKAAINAEFGEAWASLNGVRASTQLRDEPVGDVLELEPSRAVMQERKSSFPLMAIYRSGEGTYEDFSLYAQKLKQPWTLDWILGPADVATAFQLTDACVAIAKVVSLVCRLRGHPAYQGGALQFGEDGSLAAIRVVKHRGPGQAKMADSGDEGSGTTYWAISIELESLEYSDLTGSADANSVPLTGASYDVGIGGSPEGVIRGLVYADTDAPG